MSVTRLEPARGPSFPGSLTVEWVHGSPSPRHRTDPPIQVHAVDTSTFILRESKDVSFEAPFLYLLFGTERALLLDTGATADPGRFPLRRTVDGLVRQWLTDHPRPSYGLVVAHSHGHGDHVAGDSQFADRPETRVVGRDLESVQRFFGFSKWPDEVVTVDLGGRTLELFGIPGHHAASIALFDPPTRFLVTGDTVCPGRLYVRDMDAFQSSLERMARFARSRRVSYLMGGHVEMTRVAGQDFPIGARYQPRERPLPMPIDRLAAVKAAADSVAAQRGVHAFEDFVIFNGPCTGAAMKGVLRGTIWNLRYRLGRA